MRAAILALTLSPLGCSFVSKDRYGGDLERIFGETGETGEETGLPDSDESGETGETGETGDSHSGETGDSTACDDPVARDDLALQGRDVIEDADQSWRGGFGYAYLGYAGHPLGDLNQDGLPDFGLASAGSGLVFFDLPTSAEMQVLYDEGGDFQLGDHAALVGMLEYIGLEPQPAGDLDGDGGPDLILAGSGYAVDENVPGIYVVPGPLRAGDELYVLLELTRDDARQITDSSYDSWQAVGPGDLDGDGTDDLALAASVPDNGIAGVVWGGGAITGTCPGVADCVDLQLEAEDPALLGSIELDRAGDVDGDGVGDLLIGAPRRSGWSSDPTDGEAWLLSGADLSGERLTLLTDEEAVVRGWNDSPGGYLGGVGTTVAGLGDMNGDGLDDVIVGAPAGGEPQALLVLGGGAQIQLERPADGEPGHDRYAETVGAGGDVNGDCLADAVVTGWPHFDYDDEGAVFVVLGDEGLDGRSRIDASEAARMVAPLLGALSDALTAGALGDVDRDGYDDLFVGSWAWDAGVESGEGAAWLHLGGAAP